MPTGPIHNSNHSSGGSHPSSMGGSGGGHIHHGHGPVIFFGAPIHVSSGRRGTGIIGLIVFAVILVFTTIAISVPYNNNKKDLEFYNNYIEIMESDAIEYAEIIDKATKEGYRDSKGTYYVVEASYSPNYASDNKPGYYFYGYYNDIERYYIVYEYTIPGNSATTYAGETYATYTINEVRGMGGKITICVLLDSSGNCTSINSDYTLQDNTEYKIVQRYIAEANGSRNGMLGGMIICGVLAGVMVLAIIIISVKRSKRGTEEPEQSTGEPEVTETKGETKYICSYCGSVIPKDASRCPSCGSKKFKKYEEK